MTNRRAHVVAGLAFGDEGKGTMVDFLCRAHDAKLVVRYNGGPQAGHNVVLPDGRHHSFAQFGAGSFIPDVCTHLSEHVLVEPFAMENERESLVTNCGVDPMPRLTVDPRCAVITPWHWMLNKIKELSRGDARHGSCGMGVGEAREDSLTGEGIVVDDLRGSRLREKLKKVREAKLWDACGITKIGEAWNIYLNMVSEDVDDLAKFYRGWIKLVRLHLNPPEIKGNVVYEGAQGVLLDESRGFRPHTTWTNTTFDNALEMLKGEDYEVVKIGVLRTYFTRHGAGPFVGESPLVNFDDHNVEGRWQGKFRQGFFDAVAARYAIEACGGIDCLALTHLDTVIKYNDQNFVGVAAYEMNGRVVEEIDFATSTADLMACRPILDHRSATSAKSWIEDSLGVEVCYESSGQTYKEKRYLVAAAEILKITPEQMRRLRRRDARAANFGMTYGLGSNERSQK